MAITIIRGREFRPDELEVKRVCARDLRVGDVALLRGRYRRIVELDVARVTGRILVTAVGLAGGEAINPGEVVRTRVPKRQRPRRRRSSSR